MRQVLASGYPDANDDQRGLRLNPTRRTGERRGTRPRVSGRREVSLDDVRGYMGVDGDTAARIRERGRFWCNCARVPGEGFHTGIECMPELHALDMAVRAVHAEHRMRSRLPTPERICELWAEAKRRAYARVGVLAEGAEMVNGA